MTSVQAKKPSPRVAATIAVVLATGIAVRPIALAAWVEVDNHVRVSHCYDSSSLVSKRPVTICITTDPINPDNNGKPSANGIHSDFGYILVNDKAPAGTLDHERRHADQGYPLPGSRRDVFFYYHMAEADAYAFAAIEAYRDMLHGHREKWDGFKTYSEDILSVFSVLMNKDPASQESVKAGGYPSEDILRKTAFAYFFTERFDSRGDTLTKFYGKRYPQPPRSSLSQEELHKRVLIGVGSAAFTLSPESLAANNALNGRPYLTAGRDAVANNAIFRAVEEYSYARTLADKVPGHTAKDRDDRKGGTLALIGIDDPSSYALIEPRPVLDPKFIAAEEAQKNAPPVVIPIATPTSSPTPSSPPTTLPEAHGDAYAGLVPRHRLWPPGPF